MKKKNIKNLDFKKNTISELSNLQLQQVFGGYDDTSIVIRTQTNPRDIFSSKCVGNIGGTD